MCDLKKLRLGEVRDLRTENPFFKFEVCPRVRFQVLSRKSAFVIPPTTSPPPPALRSPDLPPEHFLLSQ
jgi:hypothetical protein